MRRTRHTSDSRLFFDWLEIAARDLLAARLLIEQGQCLDIAGFHCQQCLEKALKAYLLDQTGVLPDGHNLTWLCKQVAKFDESFRPYLSRTAGLNRLYIETRYPADNGLHLTADEVEEAYHFAQTVYSRICDEIYDEADVEDD